MIKVHIKLYKEYRMTVQDNATNYSSSNCCYIYTMYNCDWWLVRIHMSGDIPRARGDALGKIVTVLSVLS